MFGGLRQAAAITIPWIDTRSMVQEASPIVSFPCAKLDPRFPSVLVMCAPDSKDSKTMLAGANQRNPKSNPNLNLDPNLFTGRQPAQPAHGGPARPGVERAGRRHPVCPGAGLWPELEPDRGHLQHAVLDDGRLPPGRHVQAATCPVVGKRSEHLDTACPNLLVGLPSRPATC